MNFVGDNNVYDDQNVFYQRLSVFPQALSVRDLGARGLGVKELVKGLVKELVKGLVKELKAHRLVKKLLTIHG